MSNIDRLLDEAEKAQRKGHLLLAEVCRDASDQLGLVIEERDQLQKIVRDLLSVMPVLPVAAKHIVGMEDRYNSAITNARTALKKMEHE